MAEPKTVDISGPESTIEKINKVVAKVDVSEMSKDAKIDATLIYYDAADNIIDQSLLSSNCDKNGVTVSVTIWKTRNLTLQFDTTGIKPAAGYVFTGIEVEPQSIEVAASPEALGTIAKLEIGPDALAKTHISQTEEVVIELTEYLPEYDRYGRAAPIIRNKRIVDCSDAVVAFWDGSSKGTLSVIKYAEKIKKPCKVIIIQK